MRWAWFVVLVGCGRLGFDPLVETGSDGTDGSGPGPDAPRANDAAAIACPNVPMCPTQTFPASMTMSSYGTTVRDDHGLASTICGSGNGNPELALMYVPQLAATYRVSVTPATILYVQDGCCGGPELMCGTGPLLVQRKAGDTFVVVVEGANGMFFTVSVQGI